MKLLSYGPSKAEVTTADPPSGRWSWRDPRWADVVLGLAIATAVPVILYLNRDQWFFLDEWDFLSTRNLSSPTDLVRAHNEHWYTLPIILYRVLFRLVGLHHYWPYQMFTIGAHLIAAVLLRTVMRRAGVSPWLACIAAIVLVFFGTGRENIGWAFQVGFTAPLAFGLAHLLYADHDGPASRRDVVGIGFGLLALMCSSVGVAMAVGVGAAVLIRRGWRMAVLHAGSLAVAYVAWFVAYGKKTESGVAPSLPELARFGWQTIFQTLQGVGQSPAVGVAIGMVLVAGTALRVGRWRNVDMRRAYASTAGLLTAALSFVLLAGYGRAHLSSLPASRYMHLVAAMTLPAIALAITDLARYWRPVSVVGATLLLVGLPGNIKALEPSGAARFTLGARDSIFVMAAIPSPPGAPRSMQPLPLMAQGMTLGWLRDATAEGRVPSPRPGTMVIEPSVRLAMSLEQVTSEPPGRCEKHRGLGPVHLNWGDMLRVGGGAAVVVDAKGNGKGKMQTAGMSYYARTINPPARDHDGGLEIRLRAVTSPLSLGVGGTDAGSSLMVCRAR